MMGASLRQQAADDACRVGAMGHASVSGVSGEPREFLDLDTVDTGIYGMNERIRWMDGWMDGLCIWLAGWLLSCLLVSSSVHSWIFSGSQKSLALG